ncbi:MAG: hypothetical protein ACI4WS_12900 [Oscillospiraceae bacterium]
MAINKAKVFEKELRCIVDEHIRDATRKIVCELPDYFFTTAASSTGKYHPTYALDSGGLVRHTKAAVKICADLLTLEYNQNRFTQEQRDLMCAALILHDGMKHGLEGSKYTVADHPVVMSEYIKDNHAEDFTQEQLDMLIQAISSHMGQWNTEYKSGKEIMPKPATEMQYFVHLCDYLASRKWLEVDFGEDYYKPENYEEDELNSIINEIVSVCKAQIQNGVNREFLYETIERISGVRNPKLITELSKAQTVLAAVTSVE